MAKVAQSSRDLIDCECIKVTRVAHVGLHSSVQLQSMGTENKAVCMTAETCDPRQGFSTLTDETRM